VKESWDARGQRLPCGIALARLSPGVLSPAQGYLVERFGPRTLVAAGYGMGALLTTFPVDSMIRSSGYQSTLVIFGIVFAIVGVAAALGLRAPQAGEIVATPAQILVSGRDTNPSAMLKTSIFWRGLGSHRSREHHGARLP
jgi:OFA family oxalate/formate antiporter-like MFS transporter